MLRPRIAPALLRRPLLSRSSSSSSSSSSNSSNSSISSRFCCSSGCCCCSSSSRARTATAASWYRLYCSSSSSNSSSSSSSCSNSSSSSRGGFSSFVFVEEDGKETPVKVEEGCTVLEAAHANNVPIEGACDGQCSCSTCHVILSEELYEGLEEPSTEEDDMLDLAACLTDT
ncbi:ferredoxin, putative [Eimeria brunetti]|uniref:Ferredoxin, putative n=1 Tax=Eimeria brunetti TaxID=51314 RepID=U6LAF9_9EIME|nr:ferredoxin, putative [Eimeria brunetti]